MSGADEVPRVSIMSLPASVAVSCLVAALLAWLAVAVVIRRSPVLGLLDRPDHRSSHTAVTPTGGGIAIVAVGTLAGCAALAGGAWKPGWLALLLALLLAGFSLRDDIRPLGAGTRLAVQSVAVAGLLAAVSADAPSSLPFASILGGGGAFVFVLLGGLWWINLFNFMDGIDGLAASEALFLLVVAAMLASGAGIGDEPVTLWMLCVAAATAGFLAHNWAPARIFMGDVGSTYLGFMILAFALWTVLDGRLSVPVWLVLAALFVTDATVTLVVRLMRGERPHEAHRSHAYQRLARRWRRHDRVSLVAMLVNLLWLAPLAMLAASHPRIGWAIVALAYTPVVFAIGWCGAGRAEAYAPRST